MSSVARQHSSKQSLSRPSTEKYCVLDARPSLRTSRPHSAGPQIAIPVVMPTTYTPFIAPQQPVMLMMSTPPGNIPHPLQQGYKVNYTPSPLEVNPWESCTPSAANTSGVNITLVTDDSRADAYETMRESSYNMVDIGPTVTLPVESTDTSKSHSYWSGHSSVSDSLSSHEPCHQERLQLIDVSESESEVSESSVSVDKYRLSPDHIQENQWNVREQEEEDAEKEEDSERGVNMNYDANVGTPHQRWGSLN